MRVSDGIPFGMRRSRAILLGSLCGTLLLCAGLVGWSLDDVPIPEHGSEAFDLGEVRELARGTGPDSLRTVAVSAGSQLGLLLRAGGDLSWHDLPVYPVEMVWADGRSLLLEPATDAACAEALLPTVYFDAAAYDRMQQAMLRAEAIVTTHEHFDHVCGLTRSPHFERLASRALLTRAQLDSHAPMTGIDDRVRASVEPLELVAPTAVAPGVVLIPAPGHSPGSLWVFVRTAQGQEWLFVGDTVWTAEAMEEVRAKPRLVTWLGEEDAGEQARLVRTLVDLGRDHPEVGILVAHDAPTWERLLAEGTFQTL